MEETVTIPKSVFEGLIGSEAELICLWYGESFETLDETRESLKARYYERVIA